MIQRKKKICIDCQTPQFIFSKGRCQLCARIHYKPISKVRKPTGERALFIEIWGERPHICEHCGEPLGEEPNVAYFSHIVPKKKAPELRLVKTNIWLLCFLCHFTYDHKTTEEFQKRKNLWKNKNLNNLTNSE
jgi:5-methylcytosine-specific restriction endonuclease McrA